MSSFITDNKSNLEKAKSYKNNQIQDIEVLTSFPVGNKSQTIRQYSTDDSTENVQRLFDNLGMGILLLRSRKICSSLEIPKYGV